MDGIEPDTPCEREPHGVDWPRGHRVESMFFRTELLVTGWREAAADRTVAALGSARTVGDRLALIRSLAWLEGGRVDLGRAGTALETADTEALSRFGLQITGDGNAVRLLPDDRFRWWPDLHVQAADRRGWAEADADGVLRRLTSNVRYRSATQKAAVRGLVTQPSGSGLMVSMPTGAGKSLLFQIAALFGRSRAPGSCVIVITPTIALALDHERTLASMVGLEGSRALTGDLPPSVSSEVVAAFRRGEVPILLLSPEKALQDAIVAILLEAAGEGSSFFGLDARLTHLFVDEAHIVESWGRSFRPDFQRLPSLLARMRGVNPEVRLVLLSATLTPAAKQVLRSGWQFGGDWLEIDARVPRLEHDVVVSSFGSRVARQEALDWTVDRAPRPLIVYTTEVAEAELVHDRMSMERGYERIALFTGATGSAARRDIVDRWARDELDIVVATSAFGMGVDKSNVRSVIHACLPEGPARWYQEIGRAARDGGQALSVTLFTDMTERDDVDRASDIATSGWLSVDLAKSRWEAMLASAVDKRWEASGFRMSVDLDALRDGLGPMSGDYNRGWNMGLLTLMQRAGSIRIVSVETDGDQPTGTWELEIVDAAMLEGSSSDAWTDVFTLRERERRGALSELTPFLDVMRKPGLNCVTRTVFEMIEPASYAPLCGRCPFCRSNGIVAPRGLRSEGMEKVWGTPTGYVGPMPIGTFLVEPIDPSLTEGLPELLRRLVGVGMQQFLVAADQAREAASLLSGFGGGPGLVLSHEDWLGGAGLAAAPSAMLLPTSDRMTESVARRFLSWAASRTDAPVIVVGRRDRLVGGRRLDQFASSHAPVSETALEAWTNDHSGLEMR